MLATSNSTGKGISRFEDSKINVILSSQELLTRQHYLIEFLERDVTSVVESSE